jgi:FG-GAP repeat
MMEWKATKRVFVMNHLSISHQAHMTKFIHAKGRCKRLAACLAALGFLTIGLRMGLTADLDPETTINYGYGGPFYPLVTHDQNQFGFSLAPLSDTQFVVGVPTEEYWRDNGGFGGPSITNDVGIVYVYNVSGSRAVTITHPQPKAGDQFGYAVTGFGNSLIAVGAPLYDMPGVSGSTHGRVFLFNTAGTYLGALNNPAPASLDKFGTKLTRIGSGYFLVGAEEDDAGAANSGSVYLYNNNAQLLSSIPNPDPDVGDLFGFSIAGIGENRFVVGAPWEGKGAAVGGWVYLFDVNDPNHPIDLTPTSGPSAIAQGDRYGYAVAEVGNEMIAVGAPFAAVTVGATDVGSAGRVYLFNSDTSLARVIDNPEPETSDQFGTQIERLGQDRLLITAGNKRDNGSATGGRSYLFTVDGDLIARIENPTPASSDRFGWAIASAGEERFAIGAPWDDTHEVNAGSVYIYHAPIEEYLIGTEIPRPLGISDLDIPNGPTITPPDQAFWHNPDGPGGVNGKLYAVKPGKVIINWTPDPTTPASQLEIVQALIRWPSDPTEYQIHVANTPPVEMTGGGSYPSVSIMAQDSGVNAIIASSGEDRLFSAFGPGRSLLRLSTGSNPSQSPIYFQLIQTVNWNDPTYLMDGVPLAIGSEAMDETLHDPAAGAPYVYWPLCRYLPDSVDYPGFHDRDARTGPIYPINIDSPATEEDDMVVVYYQANRLIDPTALPSPGSAYGFIDGPSYFGGAPVRYDVQWPVDGEMLIIADNNKASIPEDPYQNWKIYIQNDPAAAGFNPNDEHAIRFDGAIYPLRDDLGTADTSEPFVIMTYEDANDGDKAKIRVFEVMAELPPLYTFDYAGTAGTLIQPPGALGDLRFDAPRHAEGISGPYWQDANQDWWAKAGGDAGELDTADVVMHFHYRMQSEFFVPGANPPAPGTLLPWLDLRAGTPGVPIDVHYDIAWPANPPTMKLVETLARAKAGLPDLENVVGGVGLIYQQSVAQGGGPSAHLLDATHVREVPLAQLPADVETVQSGGWSYLAEAPPHLRSRIAFDPVNHSLKFWGQIVDLVAGDPLILLNVLTGRDRDALLALSSDATFQQAVQNLATEAGEAILVDESSENVESYALTTGFAQGTGLVTLVTGNLPDEVVSLHIIKVVDELATGGIIAITSENPFDERLTLRHSGDFAGETDAYQFEWRVVAAEEAFSATPPPIPVGDNTQPWGQFATMPLSGDGAVDVTIQGPGKATLGDNWFVCRYRPTHPMSPKFDVWSDWTMAQLAEGWIKRVIGEINPFEQRATGGGIEGAEARFSSYRDREVNTVVDMISQAGPRWVGDIPFNQDALDDFGLIEIYETVLRRGLNLSIEGTPPEDYGPANNALLLVAGRLADLYMLLGNEAYADASDPTIAFGTDGVYGAEAASIHCFMNQTATLIDEELGLLRGRDDSLLPSVQIHPFYNRLIWNFTGDITGGEVAYALNYNIRNESGDVNGTINEADARRLYPQGHGDSWGHYLTAIMNYYRLLRSDYFTWVPRAEAVLVGGVPVSVDFLDERKFAQAAAAKARAGAEIVNLTYRREYVEDPEGQYQGYLDDDPDRAWGVSEWASRAGQGAFFDWVVGNALLPAQDNDQSHTGIQVVDRRTVQELRQIPVEFESIQGRADMADAGLNPLGLSKNVVPFDIDPAAITQGKTHFEQIYERSVSAMNNAIAVFNHANNSTQLLRRQADSVSDFQQAVVDREADFKNRLIELLGTPYEDDIGPVGDYPTGYRGPDIYHFAYIDPSQLLGLGVLPVQEKTVQLIEFDKPDGVNWPTYRQKSVTYHVSVDGYGLIKPPTWTGQRQAPGEIQHALGDLLLTETRFDQTLKELENRFQSVLDEVELLEALHDLQAGEIALMSAATNRQIQLDAYIRESEENQLTLRTTANFGIATANAIAEFLPLSAGTANDVTSAGRGAARLAGAIFGLNGTFAADAFALQELGYTQAKEIAQQQTQVELTVLNQQFQMTSQLIELRQSIRAYESHKLEVYAMAETVKLQSERFRSLLARAMRLIEERDRFRAETAAQVQEYRYKDMAFRIFRNDALQKYRAQFDLAARYVYLAAKAYDYESNLMEGDPRGPGQDFMTSIIRSRSLGLIQNGVPQTGGATGDPGLADPLARMFQNWNLVLKGQLGFNNPQTETGRFSLRSELFRVQPGFSANATWREVLRRHVVDNLFDLPEFQRYCIPFQPHDPVEPAIVIPFATTINFGLNFFGWPAGGGDNDYDSTHFATKIRSVGVWFANYNSLGGGMINTPRVYLIPVGMDIMRSPTSPDGATREWRILDQALPVPFPLSAGDLSDPDWIPQNDSLFGSFNDLRRFARFRAYHDSGSFNPAETINDSRLIGRSVWNTRWMLIIPAGALHSDRQEGIDRFIDGTLLGNGERDGFGVTDIKLFFQTYAYAGN